jgi:hypothetical protein
MLIGVFELQVSDFGLSRSMHAESNLCTNTFGTVRPFLLPASSAVHCPT